MRRGFALLALLLLAACEQKQGPLPRVSAPTPTPSPSAATSKPLPPPPTTSASAADIAAGHAKYGAMCAGCHGPQAEGIGHYPRLAGQGAVVIETKLAVFRSGQEIGSLSASMIPISRMLTEKEVKQVAAYLGTL